MRFNHVDLQLTRMIHRLDRKRNTTCPRGIPRTAKLVMMAAAALWLAPIGVKALSVAGHMRLSATFPLAALTAPVPARRIESHCAIEQSGKRQAQGPER